MEEKSFFDIFSGGMDMMYFMSYLLWGYIGMGVNMLIEVMKRKPKGESAPKKFKGIYYWDDNKKRLVISVILVPLAVIMFSELFGMDVSNERALFMGFGSDTLAEFIKRKTYTSPDKNKYE
jgi:hypothetical protein